MGSKRGTEHGSKQLARKRMKQRQKQKAVKRARERSKHFVFILKGCLLFAIIVSVLTLINTVLIPKYYYNNMWPTTTTIEQFYQMDQESVDVLIVGSSHSVTGVCPQELYNSYGIRAYNLGTEQQNLLVSYYLIKEALKYQSPKAIVLDIYMCYPYNRQEPLNSAEGFTRKVIDSMRWSKVKKEAIDAIVKVDKNQTKSSYYFVNQRFHTRWTGLNEEDFVYAQMESDEGLKGYSLLSGYIGESDYQPFDLTNHTGAGQEEAENPEEQNEENGNPEEQKEKTDGPEEQSEKTDGPEEQKEKTDSPEEQSEKTDGPEEQKEKTDSPEEQKEKVENPEELNVEADNIEEMLPLMEEYLDKIVDLCKSKEIDLILIKTPYNAASVERYNRLTEYAVENQIHYYDFNEKNLYEKIGYDFSVDNQDGGHANYWGSKKITTELGRILKEEYHITSLKDTQWEDTDEIYLECIRNAELVHITDIKEYLKAIDQSNYAIFMAVADEGSECLDKDILDGLHRLGIEGELYGHLRYSYYAVVTKDEVIEKTANESLSVSGLFREGRSRYSVASAGNEVGNSCSIKIDNREYAKNKRGLNIVVYDYHLKKVIDSVCFDTFIPELTAIR
ncbi:MAG: hypothetical protein II919_05620 [Lachnospiraceae bacterium]|nr:hypothetical protein [Lachnospiraceae bacterium]